MDVCGNNIVPVLESTVDTPDPLTCEGTRVYTYSYTDCSGLVSYWTYTYTIDMSTLPVVPADGSSIVECLVDAVAPTTPVVIDVCGNNIIPVLESTVDTPDPLTCEGTRVYTYSYTDCSGLVSYWTYTYTIDVTTLPVVSADGSSTVECLVDAVAPTTPVVTDVCGNNIVPVLESTVDTPDPLTCEGTRVYTYSYTDCSGLVSYWTYTYTIDLTTAPVVPTDGSSTVECLADAIAPTTPVVNDLCGNIITPVLESMVDTPDPLTCEGTRVYTYSYTDCAGNVTYWLYTYTIDLISTPAVPANGSSIVACAAEALPPSTPIVNDQCGNVLTAVLIDIVDSPDPLICAGIRTYNYSYTDCSGNVSYWSYIYNVEDPVITVTCPPDQVIDAVPGDLYTIPELLATNNCGGGFTVTWDITGATIRSGTGTDASGLFNVGISDIEWTVTDMCGNVYNCNTIVEIVFPTIICPSNNQYCIDAGQQLLTNTGETPLGGEFSGTNVVENAGQYFFNPADGEGVHTVTYTWWNTNGYEGSCVFDITVHPLPDFDATIANHPLCFGSSDAELDITINDGTADYNIDWSISSDITSLSNYTVTGLSSGAHTINVTDFYGCQYSQNVDLIDPPALSATISISSDYNGQDISCNGQSDGSAIVYPLGGTGNYYYNWGASALNQISQEAVNLSAGTHSVIVTDDNGCTVSTDIIITEPDQIDVSINLNENVSCFGLSDGNADVNVSGGTPDYTYLWNDPLGTSISNASQLPAGNWTVVVTDNNMCTSSAAVVITEPDELVVSHIVNDVVCFGESNGSASVTVNGGTPNYQYYWSNSQHSFTDYIMNVPAGVYTVVVTDANNCQEVHSIEINQPDLLMVTCNTVPVVCETALGSAIATPVGGNGGYLYEWSNGGVTAQINNLVRDCYDVVVTDMLGCEAEATACVNVQGVINVSITEDNSVSCFGDNDAILIADAQAAANPVSYLWSNNETTPINSNVGAGFYYVTASDDWGCTGYQSYDLNQPNQIILSFNSVPVMCFGGNDGSVMVDVGGGVLPYNYLWSNSDTTQLISNLASGNYFVTVTDNNDCFEEGQVIVDEPENRLNLNLIVSNVSCYGESDGYINSQAVGGTPPYSYLWHYGEYTSTSSNLNNLFSDQFNLSVIDANDCTIDTVVTVNEPAAIDANYNYGDPSCIGNDDGFIEVSVIGGTEPYLYSWNGGESPVQYISGLIQGLYTVSITDANNCLFELAPINLEDVDEDCIRIPNAFTPNGDGINDTWIIENIDMYPNAFIHVYNRWGQQIFEAKGSEYPWDGTYNGHYVPSGSYLYLIELFDGTKPRTGIVTVMY